MSDKAMLSRTAAPRLPDTDDAAERRPHSVPQRLAIAVAYLFAGTGLAVFFVVGLAIALPYSPEPLVYLLKWVHERGLLPEVLAVAGVAVGCVGAILGHGDRLPVLMHWAIALRISLGAEWSMPRSRHSVVSLRPQEIRTDGRTYDEGVLFRSSD